MAKKKNNNSKVKTEKKNKKIEVSEEKETKEVVKTDKARNKKTTTKTNTESKQSLWVRFRIFCHGVATETKRIHWVSRDKLIKYSIAVIVLVIFLALFFYFIDAIFAAIQSLFK